MLFEWFLGRFGVFTRKGIANIQNGNSQKKTYNTPNLSQKPGHKASLTIYRLFSNIFLRFEVKRYVYRGDFQRSLKLP